MYKAVEDIDLFVGGRNVSEDGSWTSCRGEGRNSFCVQYDFDNTADMSGDTIRSDASETLCVNVH